MLSGELANPLLLDLPRHIAIVGNAGLPKVRERLLPEPLDDVQVRAKVQRDTIREVLA